jgi:hypothetical protein
MAAMVIDASVASAWCFPDEQTDYTIAIFQAVASSAVEMVAPGLWAYEVRNSILMGFAAAGLASRTAFNSSSH